MRRRDFFKRLAQVALGSAAVAVGVKAVESDVPLKRVSEKILPPGCMYGVTEPVYIGEYKRTIKWKTWENIDMYVGNVAGVRKLELYTGHAVPDQNTVPKRVHVF